METKECLYCYKQFKVDTIDSNLPEHNERDSDIRCIGSGRQGMNLGHIYGS
jgi:hypothetical protein